MVKQENPNFIASKYAPNPKEVSYWIDLATVSYTHLTSFEANNTWQRWNSSGSVITTPLRIEQTSTAIPCLLYTSIS